MSLKNPFGWMSEKNQRIIFMVSLIFAVVLFLVFQVIDSHLKTELAPLGIVSFQLAGELSVAQDIIASWGQEGQLYAMLSLGLDYLFMLLYAVVIGLGCIMVARGLPKGLEKFSDLGVWLAWGQILAALMDALENFGLVSIMLGTEVAVWAKVVQVCATGKFALIALGLVYITIGLVLRLTAKNKF